MTRITLPRELTETAWTAWVIDLATRYGWHVAHYRPARTDHGWRTPISGHAGAPDLLLARDGDVLLAELKTNRGRLGPGQQEWLDALGNHAYLWRPRDADHVLARLAKTKP